MIHTIVVCINSIIPIASGCFIWVNMILVIVLVDISNFVISGGILYKILAKYGTTVFLVDNAHPKLFQHSI
jgi:hypothetical protein